MDQTVLVNPDIEAGKILVDALSGAGLPLAFAGWLKVKDSPEWTLYIASPDVQVHGPLAILKFVDKIAEAVQSPLRSVEIVNTTNHFVNSISLFSLVSGGSKWGISFKNDRVEFVRGVFDSVEIENGIVYLIDRKAKPSSAPPRANSIAIRKAKAHAA